jgi:IclR family transcriptional regulator, pca regulon regulatory protein
MIERMDPRTTDQQTDSVPETNQAKGTPGPFEDSPDYVQSLARGLSVVRAFDREHARLTLSAVAQRTGLTRAVARRNLLTLRHLGYVGADGREFYLRPRVLELGYSYLASLGLGEIALQAMEELSHRVGESCSMAVLDDADIVYVARVPVRRVMSIALGVGARLPAFATSMGRVLLAALSDVELDAWLDTNKLRAITANTLHKPGAWRAEVARVRRDGHALVAQELELGLCSIAVPVRTGNGRVVAGLNVGMAYSDGVRERALKRVLPVLLRTRESIERTLARSGWLPAAEVRRA